jgi:hypothetical protein
MNFNLPFLQWLPPKASKHSLGVGRLKIEVRRERDVFVTTAVPRQITIPD